MHARFSGRAREDLRLIYKYIAEWNPTSVERLTDSILAAIVHLQSFPFLGRVGRLESTRELVVPGLPYVVVYSLPDQYHVVIERILHGARQWPPEEAV
ncbi:MAG: type II toxin-antitoxin system RelE/ParE family toxin [Pseudomonadota bacterium]